MNLGKDLVFMVLSTLALWLILCHVLNHFTVDSFYSAPSAVAAHPPIICRLVQQGGGIWPTGRGGPESQGVRTATGEDFLPAGTGAAKTVGAGPGRYI